MNFGLDENIAIQANTQTVDITFFSKLDLVNKILKKYPDKNIYFMAGPVGLGFNSGLAAKTIKSSYEFDSIVTYDQLIESLEEVIDYCEGDNIFLYSFGITFIPNDKPLAKIRFANEEK